MISRLIQSSKHLISSLENPTIGFGNYVLTFIFVVTVRCFLEAFSDNEAIILSLLSHYYLAYACLAMSLLVVFHYVTREGIAAISRVVLPSFIVLVIAPLLDLLISLGKGYDMSYMLPGSHDNLLLRFCTFFGPFEKFGVTPGIRIEIALVIVASWFYFFSKTGNVLKSLAGSFFVYCLLFLFGMMPYASKVLLGALGESYQYSAQLMRDSYLFLILIILPWVYYLHNKKYCLEIIKDLRYLRIIHYELMFLLGIVLSRGRIELTSETMFGLIFAFTALLHAGLFSLIMNNLADYDIDSIVNRSRPSVSMSIPSRHYARLAWIAFAVSVVYSMAVSFRYMYLLLVVIAIYYLYSMPPFRLKRVPVLSKLLIALNSLVLFIAGWSFMGGTLRIPINVILFAMLGLTAVVNFIDLKDYDGDKAAGIRTVPTMLGMGKAKLIIGLCFVIVYPLSYFVHGDVDLLIPSVLTGILVFLLINRRRYRERPVFVVYVVSLIALFGYLWGSGASTELQTSGGRLAQYEELYRKMVAIDENVPGPYLGLGDVVLRQGRREEARKLFGRAVELDPGSADAHYNLGVAHSELGEIEEAKAAYRSALEIIPDHALALNNLGDLDRQEGDIEKALDHFRRAAKAAPGHIESRFNIGSILLQQGKPQEAIPWLKEAVALKSELEVAQNLLALAYLQSGNVNEAKERYEMLTRMFPRSPVACLQLARIAYRSGERQQTIEWLRRAWKRGREPVKRAILEDPDLKDLEVSEIFE